VTSSDGLYPGRRFAPVPIDLSATRVRGYLNAVGDTSPLYAADASLVPPLAVAALALIGVADQFVLPPGSLHAGQELEFHRPVRLGEQLVAQAEVVQRSDRDRFAMVVIALRAVDDKGAPALSGRATLMVAHPGQVGEGSGGG